MRLIQPNYVVDTGYPTSQLTSNIPENDYPVHSFSTVYSTGDRVIFVGDNIHKVYESLAGVTGTVTMTTANPTVVTWTAHGIVANTPISFTSSGTLPTGITAGVVYYVKSPTTDTFSISTTIGGASVAVTAPGTGVYTAKASANFNVNPVTNAGTTNAVWLDAGATNRWKMFDSSVQSQSKSSGDIIVSVKTPGYVDTVVLLNIKAVSVNVTMQSSDGTVVYNQTKSLVNNIGVVNWYKYFFLSTNKKTDVVFEKLPRYAMTTITVTFNGAGASTACGALIKGLTRDISYKKTGVEQGAKLGFVDYSLKNTDAFGNMTVKERAFNRRTNWTIYVEGREVDDIYNLLASYRATPIVYIGGADYGSSIIYGFFKSFDIEIAYIDMPAVITIEIEGLT